jgi:hypothetical protein
MSGNRVGVGGCVSTLVPNYSNKIIPDPSTRHVARPNPAILSHLPD